jgi:uncharacterized membrane protein
MPGKPAPHAPHTVPDEGAEPLQPLFGLDRLVFFSDAVMAIAITLLVLDIKVPEATSEAALAPLILGLWPKYLGYAVSFWVIAMYWVAHHRCFRYIRKYDRRLIYLNFLFLMFIAFLPYPTAVLFTDPSMTASVVLYAGTTAGMGLSLAGVWLYAARHHFILAGLPSTMARDIRLNLLLPPVVFLASCVVAFLNANLAMFTWILLFPAYVFRLRRQDDRSEYEAS